MSCKDKINTAKNAYTTQPIQQWFISSNLPCCLYRPGEEQEEVEHTVQHHGG
jgi:hypothetical protein